MCGLIDWATTHNDDGHYTATAIGTSMGDNDEPEWLRRASDTLATAAPAAKPGRKAAPAEDDEFDEAAIRKAAAKHAASLLRAEVEVQVTVRGGSFGVKQRRTLPHACASSTSANY